MTIMYANSRETLPSNAWNITTSTGGELTARTIYLSLQTENRIGRNYLLVSSLLTIPATGKITITINSTAKLEAEEILQYVIGISNTPNLYNFNQLFTIPVDTNTVFPIVIVIDKEENILNSPIVSELPIDNLIQGMLRGLTTTGLIYEYFDGSEEVVDDLEVLFSDNGRWIARGTFSTYVSNIYSEGGSRIDLRDEIESLPIIPKYNPTGNESEYIRLWLTDTNLISSGTKLTFSIKCNEYIKTLLFDRKLIYEFEGYVNLDTCEIRKTLIDDITPFDNLDIPIVFNANTPNFTLEEDLPVGYALSLKISLKFIGAEINGFIPEGSIISIYPSFLINSGTYTEAGSIIGDCIFNELGKRRVYPEIGNIVKVKSGSGLVSNYIFNNLPGENIFSLPANSDFNIYINTNGFCFTIPTETPLNCRIRAKCSTRLGFTTPSAWSSFISSTSKKISLTITYPDTIRSTYPDVIANSDAVFNIPYINVYAQLGYGEIRKFKILVNNNSTTHTLDLPDFTTGEIVSSLPNNTELNYGLFNSPYFVIDDSSDGNYTGTYRFCIGYEYDGTTISVVNHSVSVGCIPELDITLSDALNNMKYYGSPLVQSELVSLNTDNIPDGHRRLLKQSNNQYLDLIFHKYQTGVGNNIDTFKELGLSSSEPGLWVQKEVPFTFQDVSDYVLTTITPNIATITDLIRTVDDSIIPLIIGLGGGGSPEGSTTVNNTTSSSLVDYPLITVNATTITPNLTVSDKYFFVNSISKLSSVKNPLNISNGDKFSIQTNSTGTYLFDSGYYLPENYTSVNIDSKAIIEATQRGTSTDIIIYSIW